MGRPGRRKMAATPTSRKRTTARKRGKAPSAQPSIAVGDSRWERKFREIVEHATAVFYEKGYEGASMRDLSRASGMSLAGLYYYFESKEKLLYLIQQHTFCTVTEQARERLREVSDPEQRVRVFIENHLEYFLNNMKAMKVLSHEANVLGKGMGEEIQAIKREYYNLCRKLLQELQQSKGVQSVSVRSSRGANEASSKPFSESKEKDGGLRVAVLSLFGMMNWIYTWYNPRVDGDAKLIASQMANTFLTGVLSACMNGTGRSSTTRQKS